MKAQTPSLRSPHRLTTPSSTKSALLCLALAVLNAPAVMAQQCISLQGSSICPAFNQSSISTDSAMTAKYPFLAYVSNAATFDTQLTQYIGTTYAQQKYQQLLGCTNLNLTNTTDLYARYTATFLCNAIVQQSVGPCGLTGSAALSACADTCAEFAQSEESIASTGSICGNTSSDAIDLIRADFTTCALPAGSLSNDCISGPQNEPDNCGFSSNLGSLCAFCAASSPNATDSCCIYSQSETRCVGVKLPITTSMGSIYSTTSAVASATGSPSPSSHSKSGLSGGAIAGIVIGSVVGALLLLGVIIACCVFARRHRESQHGSIFNQPSPSRQGPPQQMAYSNGRAAQAPEVLPVGARVHQMTALEGSSSHGEHSSPIAGGGYGSSGYDDTPESQRSGLGVAAIGKRGGSLREDHSSPGSGEEYSSPEGLASGQSEQMSHFKDYYSQDDIRPNDTVAVLWAYQPRANDEWELDRGDMLKVVGIWDDGWATGVKIRERAEEWEARRQGNRDSGVSNGSSRRPMSTEPVADGEIKAFPLVCVCLPQHWRKTIEGDSGERGPGEGPGSP